ncbi:MAG: hypothetical protein ACLRWQ_17640 [Flavonifractor plautii]
MQLDHAQRTAPPTLSRVYARNSRSVTTIDPGLLRARPCKRGLRNADGTGVMAGHDPDRATSTATYIAGRRQDPPWTAS